MHAAKRRNALRLLRPTLLAVVLSAMTVAASLAIIWQRTEPVSLARAEALSVTVLDRNDRLLRAYTASDGSWRLPVEVKDVDPRYLAMLLAFEDRRFRSHHGVDPVAIGRAGWQLARPIAASSPAARRSPCRWRACSPASTSARVPARCARRCARCSSSGKLSKDAILRLYLRLAPFGGNLEGVRAASLAYFGKEPRRLSLAEAALLVALPQSPELRRPDRFPQAALRARNRVLAHAAAQGIIPADEAPARQGRAHADACAASSPCWPRTWRTPRSSRPRAASCIA